MTANQIEYWKLQESKRHNLVTEAMDKPVKEAQALNYYSNSILAQEQAKTEETKRGLNLAQTEAAYSQAALNYAKAETEQYNQGLLSISLEEAEAQKPGIIAEATYNNLIQQGRVDILNEYPGKVKGTAAVYNFTDKWNFSSKGGLNIGSIVNTAISLFKGGK